MRNLTGSSWPIVLAALALTLGLSAASSAQFGLNVGLAWSTFTDPGGRFALSVPPRWSYQPEEGDADTFVFFGPGDQDFFYVEVLPASSRTPLAVAQEAMLRYAGQGGLPGFRMLSGPVSGTLAERDASFVVYAYTLPDGTTFHEGRAFVVDGSTVFSLAFVDAADRFEASVPLFNGIMTTFQILPRTPGFGFGNTSPAPSQAEPQPAGTARPSGPYYYTSPGRFFTLTVPESWEVWEELSTARGDVVDATYGLFNWGSRPMTKVLFLWNHFDAWEQTGGQYEIIFGVIENVSGSEAQAIESLKNALVGSLSAVYTTATTRLRVGDQNATAVEIAVRPGYVEPWTVDSGAFYKKTVFYVFKRGTTLFFAALPREMAGHDVVRAALESFRWIAG